MNKLIRFLSDNRLFFALLFYQALISVRIFIEMRYLTLYIFIHQLFWFTGVLIWFFFVFKWMLKVDANRIWFFCCGAFLTYIPLIYATLMGERWSLNYVSPETFKQVLYDMATFLFYHPRNWPMFYELVLLFIFTLAAAIYISKDVLRSFFVTVLAVYGSFLVFGFSWISVAENHPSAITFSSTFDPQKFYAVQMIGRCSILLVLTAWKDIKDFIVANKINLIHVVLVFVVSFMLLMSGSVLVTSSDFPTIADLAVTASPVFLLSGSIYFAIKLKTVKPFLIPIHFSVFLMIILFYIVRS
jgi:hypothetical protein